MGEDGLMEVEFYQSAPATSALELQGPPQATVAIYDSMWNRVALDSSSSKRVSTGADSLWVALNRVVVEPGRYLYVVRLDIPGHRALSGKNLLLTSYSGSRLDLSGVILGTPSPPGWTGRIRGGLDILPRPSLTFRPGEIISVFFEIYGLKKDTWGERRYSERVTVSVTEKTGRKLGGILNVFKFWGRRQQAKSLTLSFDRQAAGTEGLVEEYFEIDTSQLVTGNYQLKLEVEDQSSGMKRDVTWFFDLESAGE